MKLVVGLGNPGKKYEKTRHNVGWRVLDALDLNFLLEKKFNSELAEVKRGSEKVLYCKPQTFMNNSGHAVRMIADYYTVDRANIIVVYDDKDLPFGTVRLRSEGSAGGHNGVQSIIEHLGEQEGVDFARVRIGVAPEDEGQRTRMDDTSKYVLSTFTADEEKNLPLIIEIATHAIEKLLEKGSGKTSHQDLKL